MNSIVEPGYVSLYPSGASLPEPERHLDTCEAWFLGRLQNISVACLELVTLSISLRIHLSICKAAGYYSSVANVGQIDGIAKVFLLSDSKAHGYHSRGAKV